MSCTGTPAGRRFVFGWKDHLQDTQSATRSLGLHRFLDAYATAVGTSPHKDDLASLGPDVIIWI